VWCRRPPPVLASHCPEAPQARERSTFASPRNLRAVAPKRWGAGQTGNIISWVRSLIGGARRPTRRVVEAQKS
jgi:hypothetical protein